MARRQPIPRHQRTEQRRWWVVACAQTQMPLLVIQRHVFKSSEVIKCSLVNKCTKRECSNYHQLIALICMLGEATCVSVPPTLTPHFYPTTIALYAKMGAVCQCQFTKGFHLLLVPNYKLKHNETILPIAQLGKKQWGCIANVTTRCLLAALVNYVANILYLIRCWKLATPTILSM